MHPTIVAIGTAVPENSIDQSQIVDFMINAHELDENEARQLKVLYRATGINTRHSVVNDYASKDPAEWSFYPQSSNLEPFPSTKSRMDIYRKEAIHLSKQAIEKCLDKSDIDAQDITHLITISCTGMYAPGLDIDIIDHCGLNKTVDRTAINFMGCFAAMTGIKQAYHICQSTKKSNVLVICIELCTLHFQKEKSDDNLLANAIFGDGAAALMMSSQESEAPGLRPIKFQSDLLPDSGNDMAWNIGNFGYEMKLSAYVPELIQSGVQTFISRLISALDKKPEHFAVHPGGKKILEVIESELGISKKQNECAREILRQFGNMSSPTVLFVLELLLSRLSPRNKGEKVLSLAFGPGLTIESMILELT